VGDQGQAHGSTSTRRCGAPDRGDRRPALGRRAPDDHGRQARRPVPLGPASARRRQARPAPREAPGPDGGASPATSRSSPGPSSRPLTSDPSLVSQIATGSKRKNFDIKSAHLEHLFGPFSGKILCGDDPILEGKGKPDPTIFVEAAKMLDIQCVLLSLPSLLLLGD